MYIKNIFSTLDKGKLLKQPFIDGFDRQAIVLHMPAGEELKPHISKVDTLLIVQQGKAVFTLWDNEESTEYLLEPFDVVAFKANQRHAVKATEAFSAFVIK